MTKRILVNGAGGFIGGHLVKRLKREGYWFRGLDLKDHEFSPSPTDEFIIGHLPDQTAVWCCTDMLRKTSPWSLWTRLTQ